MNTHPRSRRILPLALGLTTLSAVSTTAQTDRFRITGVRHSDHTTTLQWESATAWSYTVKRSTSLAPDSWSNVALCVDLPGADGFLAATDTLQSASWVFYRVERRQPPYQHTITIDGINDFTLGETFATSSSSYTAFISWDSVSLYLGMQGLDIGANSSNIWVLVYLSGSPGTLTGVAYNSQQPLLPFPAKYHLRWRTDLHSSALAFDGASWANLPPGSEGSWNRSGFFMEWRIPLATIGNPSQFDLHVSMLDEGSGSEWSYAAVPQYSFTDGLDPDYFKYFHFDMTNSSIPNASSPMP